MLGIYYPLFVCEKWNLKSVNNFIQRIDSQTFIFGKNLLGIVAIFLFYYKNPFENERKAKTSLDNWGICFKVHGSITFFQFHPWQFNFGLNDSNDGEKNTLCDRLFLNRHFFLIRYFIYSHPKSSPIYLLLIDFNLNLENDLSST